MRIISFWILIIFKSFENFTIFWHVLIVCFFFIFLFHAIMQIYLLCQESFWRRGYPSLPPPFYPPPALPSPSLSVSRSQRVQSMLIPGKPDLFPNRGFYENFFFWSGGESVGYKNIRLALNLRFFMFSPPKSKQTVVSIH